MQSRTILHFPSFSNWAKVDRKLKKLPGSMRPATRTTAKSLTSSMSTDRPIAHQEQAMWNTKHASAAYAGIELELIQQSVLECQQRRLTGDRFAFLLW